MGYQLCFLRQALHELKRTLRELNRKKRKEIEERLAYFVDVLARGGRQAIVGPHFRRIQGQHQEELYRMRLSRNPNLRLLFYFDDRRGMLVFLKCFKEEKKADYKGAIRTALERKKKYEEGSVEDVCAQADGSTSRKGTL